MAELEREHLKSLIPGWLHLGLEEFAKVPLIFLSNSKCMQVCGIHPGLSYCLWFRKRDLP